MGKNPTHCFVIERRFINCGDSFSFEWGVRMVYRTRRGTFVGRDRGRHGNFTQESRSLCPYSKQVSTEHNQSQRLRGKVKEWNDFKKSFIRSASVRTVAFITKMFNENRRQLATNLGTCFCTTEQNWTRELKAFWSIEKAPDVLRAQRGTWTEFVRSLILYKLLPTIPTWICQCKEFPLREISEEWIGNCTMKCKYT